MKNSTKVPGVYLVILYKKLVLKTYIADWIFFLCCCNTIPVTKINQEVFEMSKNDYNQNSQNDKQQDKANNSNSQNNQNSQKNNSKNTSGNNAQDNQKNNY